MLKGKTIHSRNEKEQEKSMKCLLLLLSKMEFGSEEAETVPQHLLSVLCLVGSCCSIYILILIP